MSVVIITGSGGLIGSQAARHFSALGMHVVGIDNDTRGQLFGPDGSVRATIKELADLPGYTHVEADVCDFASIAAELYGREVELVVHCAAQPAHESGAPMVDWNINASGSVNVLDAVRRHAPDALFVHLSTIKVYGQHPNQMWVDELETRYEPTNPRPKLTGATWSGFSEAMSIDGGEHSIFGASKTAADLMAQEYAYAYGLRTVILRPGCLTGAGHAAVEAHGFLGHLVRCVAEGRLYQVHGNGKQVRDQIHASDVVTAIEHIWRDPPEPGTVFNLGGGRGTDVSVLEALDLAEQATGRVAKFEHVQSRAGDHRWWVTDMTKFRERYPDWAPDVSLADMVQEIADRWRP